MKYFISYIFGADTIKNGSGNVILDVPEIKTYEHIKKIQDFITETCENDYTTVMFYTPIEEEKRK